MFNFENNHSPLEALSLIFINLYELLPAVAKGSPWAIKERYDIWTYNFVWFHAHSTLLGFAP